VTAEKQVVKDCIIPIDRYPHLRDSQTLSDAVQILLSYTCGNEGRLQYGGVLIINESNQLTGCLNLQTILRALDRRLADSPGGFEGKDGKYPDLAFLWEESFFRKCSEKHDIPIKDFMISSNTIVKGSDPLLKALSIMLHNNEIFLPVSEDGNIIGVIRLEEIFTAICSACRL